MIMMRIVYLALLLMSAVSAQTTEEPPTTVNNATDTASDSPSDIPSMAPSDGEPTTAQISMPSLMPVTGPDSMDAAPTSLPTSAKGSTCDICGEGREVGEPEKGLIFEGRTITCEQLQEFGQSGMIPIDDCVKIIAVLDTQDHCSCQDDQGQEPGTGEATPPTSSATCLMSSFAVTAMAAASTISLLLVN